MPVRCYGQPNYTYTYVDKMILARLDHITTIDLRTKSCAYMLCLGWKMLGKEKYVSLLKIAVLICTHTFNGSGKSHFICPTHLYYFVI
jgi:hypothetical protein